MRGGRRRRKLRLICLQGARRAPYVSLLQIPQCCSLVDRRSVACAIKEAEGNGGPREEEGDGNQRRWRSSGVRAGGPVCYSDGRVPPLHPLLLHYLRRRNGRQLGQLPHRRRPCRHCQARRAARRHHCRGLFWALWIVDRGMSRECEHNQGKGWACPVFLVPRRQPAGSSRVDFPISRIRNFLVLFEV